VPRYLYDEVQFVKNIHDHNTRNIDDFYITPTKSSFGQKSLFQSGLQLYNSIRSELKLIKNTKPFKIACTYINS